MSRIWLRQETATAYRPSHDKCERLTQRGGGGGGGGVSHIDFLIGFYLPKTNLCVGLKFFKDFWVVETDLDASFQTLLLLTPMYSTSEEQETSICSTLSSR